MGLASRRRYRWTRGRITDYWDEVFTAEGFDGHAAALDDQSAFIASLGSSRSARMRDVLGTIQADQDAIIRAGSRGALVVDGGPGTGKTVVALHRTAYLLYSDPRLGHRRGGVLFVGPHQPYLAYVADVLPSLGEEGVQTCTLRDLVPEGATAGGRGRPASGPAEVRRADWWRRSSRPSGSTRSRRRRGMTVETDAWGDVWLERRRLGRGLRGAGPRHAAQRGARPGLGGSCSRSSSTSTTATRTAPATLLRRVAGRRTASCVATLQPGLAAARADRPRRRPVVGAGLPAPVRAVARAPTSVRRCSATDPQAWTVVRPAAARRRPAAARRPGGVAAQAPAARPTVAAERERMADVVDRPDRDRRLRDAR